MSIQILTEPRYLDQQSTPDEGRYAFAYTITITNQGEHQVQLLSRHWFITDGNNKVQEVQGDGVVGEQPVILPGESFRYTSGAIIQTPVGTMHGAYHFIDHEEHGFEVPIPVFRLSQESSLH